MIIAGEGLPDSPFDVPRLTSAVLRLQILTLVSRSSDDSLEILQLWFRSFSATCSIDSNFHDLPQRTVHRTMSGYIVCEAESSGIQTRLPHPTFTRVVETVHCLSLETIFFTAAPAHNAGIINKELEVVQRFWRVRCRDAVREPELGQGIDWNVTRHERVVDESWRSREGIIECCRWRILWYVEDIKLRDQVDRDIAIYGHVVPDFQRTVVCSERGNIEFAYLDGQAWIR